MQVQITNRRPHFGKVIIKEYSDMAPKGQASYKEDFFRKVRISYSVKDDLYQIYREILGNLYTSDYLQALIDLSDTKDVQRAYKILEVILKLCETAFVPYGDIQLYIYHPEAAEAVLPVEELLEVLRLTPRFPGSTSYQRPAGSFASLPGEATGDLNIDLIRALDKELESKEEDYVEYMFRIFRDKGIDNYASVYNRTLMSRQTFNKIVNHEIKKPGKRVLWSIIIGAGFTYEEAVVLFRKANSSINRSEADDIILEYCIRNGIYDVNIIDTLLLHYHQQPLIDYDGVREKKIHRE